MARVGSPRVLETSRVSRHGKQTYETPAEFIGAVQRRFGRIGIDLAASDDNAKASRYFSEDQGSLKHNWAEAGGSEWCWLNPPYARIEPWAAKCAEESARGARILMLVLASVGSTWFARHVWHRASVLFLSPRLTFVGETNPYTKDLILCVYDRRFPAAVDLWRWE